MDKGIGTPVLGFGLPVKDSLNASAYKGILDVIFPTTSQYFCSYSVLKFGFQGQEKKKIPLTISNGPTISILADFSSFFFFSLLEDKNHS